MNIIWYEPLIEALRHHIESEHMMEEDALIELTYTEDHLDYASQCDGDLVTIGCPWSQHCNCDWKVEGLVNFKLKIVPDSDRS